MASATRSWSASWRYSSRSCGAAQIQSFNTLMWWSGSCFIPHYQVKSMTINVQCIYKIYKSYISQAICVSTICLHANVGSRGLRSNVSPGGIHSRNITPKSHIWNLYILNLGNCIYAAASNLYISSNLQVNVSFQHLIPQYSSSSTNFSNDPVTNNKGAKAKLLLSALENKAKQ